MKTIIFIIAFLLNSVLIWSQELLVEDSLITEVKPASIKFSFNGYVKDMQSLSFPKDFKSLLATNLIHNRINFKWFPFMNLTFATELRNRLIWGDDVRIIPDYNQLLRNSNELVNISNIWFSNSSMVMHTNIDRLYIDYKLSRLSIRAGRHRINWGISTIWNPNDLFNTYNFLDFDYEERPGTDAIKFSGDISGFSNVEIAYSPGNKVNEKVLAGKYFVNSGGYDIQLLFGIYGNRFTAGGGWAGSIGDAGFKGETQFFTKTSSEKFHINMTIESDYVFESGWYFSGSFLFNNIGLDTKILNPSQLNFNFSPANLMPTKWNFTIASGKEITPLFSANLSVLYSPGTNLLLFLPGLKYSLGENLNVDLVWQSFYASLNQFEALNHRGYLRLKYNF
ncbi:MAG: hypothetical protein HOP11_04535 [Saprospiraceae bacterium]|nr:hypothetical protein [Saprospiraceae bacterium]